MTELLTDKEFYSSQLSLNKAAHLLGVNEINNFDYKSLNSIRKLAKTLGCNEYDLMKSFNNNSNVAVDVIIFTFYSDQLTIDVETGIVTK